MNFLYSVFSVSREGGWEFHPFCKGSVSAMGRAAARGRVLLQSPVVFQPIAPHPFPVTALCSFCVFRFYYCIRGFHCLDLDFVSTAYATGAFKVHTIVASHRPLESTSGECSYVLAGTGSAVLIQHNILSFLYTPDGTNTDLRAFGCSASAIQLVTQTWTQVDTPSVSSQQAGNGFFPRRES